MAFLDGSLLLGYCFLQLLLVPVDLPFLVAFLTSLTVLYGDTLLKFDRKGQWRLGVFALLEGLFPPFCLFLPAVSYLAFSRRQWWFAGVSLLLTLLPRENAISMESLCLVLVGLAFSLLSQMKTRKIMEARQQLHAYRDDSREKNLLLEEKNKVLREKQDYEVYTATLRERNRIAREIHDNVGHLLSRSILLVGALKTINAQAPLQEPLENLGQSLNDAMTSIRTSVHDLHDEAIDLETASREVLEGFRFCPVQFEYDMGRGIPRELKYCYLAILKESLNNVVRHSNARHVKVIMREQPALYQLSIQDDGSACGKADSGIGLSNMDQRVKELGGYLRIGTEKGFEIFITIPKKEEVQ